MRGEAAQACQTPSRKSRLKYSVEKLAMSTWTACRRPDPTESDQ